MRRRSSVVLLGLVLAWASGCGPGSPAREPPAAEPTRPARDERPAPVEAAPAPVAPVQVDPEVWFDETTCVLRAAGGAVRAECTEGALTCTEIARADLAEPPGDEVVTRCDDDEPGGRALAVANGDALLFVHRLDAIEVPGRWTCSFAWRSDVTLVDVVPGPRRELLVRTRECVGAGELGDADQLFAWGASGMVAVAGAGVDCQYTGNTGDPDAPEPPADERYVCEGGYLDVTAGGVARIDVPEPVTVSADRDAEGRVALGPTARRVALRWDGAAFRFETP